jgi:2-polyprenyl-3-methyl-5-hydroxy-6-metoxy-1,4-benzoquinol methylase
MPQQRLTPEQMRLYWKRHSQRWTDLDYERDPDGLGNVCHAGASLWLNRYYARFQRQVYARLLSALPAIQGGRALDVGCGAGRWCTVLRQRGYAVTGIDLQEDLIDANRKRYPDMHFEFASIQDFPVIEPCDLVSSVTVLQHIPFVDQEYAVQRLRMHLRPGGHALLLENVRDQAPHVFARAYADWVRLLEHQGFRLVQAMRYDYSPTLQCYAGLIALLKLLRGASAAKGPEAWVEHGAERSEARRVHQVIRNLAVLPDYILEPLLIALQPPWFSVHAGFLFKAI